ncbi:uncharacterized protein LOC144353988, partial [Saccoglossus kowalevskii]
MTYDMYIKVDIGLSGPVLTRDYLRNRLSCLLYADDLVLLSETSSGLQNAINNLQDYCKQWMLHINISKSKSMIFNKSGKLLNNFKFQINGSELERVSAYKYLGMKLNLTGKFDVAQQDLKNRALK